MKNIRLTNIIICFFAIAAGLSSCSDDWLDTRPKDMIVYEDFWKTREDLNDAIAGCYRSAIDDWKVDNPTWYKGAVGLMILWGELRADNLTTGGGITTDESRVMTCNISYSNRLASWSPIYTVINNCNIFLDNADLVLNHVEDMSQAEVDAYKAEALALRSLMYFYLVRTYKEVPLRLKGFRTNDDETDVPKVSEASVITQLITDLEWAYDKAYNSYDNNSSYDYDKGRFTKTSVAALQADVYLWAEMYPECEEACNRVLANKTIKLYNSSLDHWIFPVFKTGNSTESIFEFQYGSSSEGKVNNVLFESYGSNRRTEHFRAPLEDNTGWSLNAIFTINEAVDDADIRQLYSYSSSLSSVTGSASINKFVSSETTRANWVLYRLPEIYFMKAEALVMQNFDENKEEALELVNKIFMRSHPTFLEIQKLKIENYNTQQSFLDLILLEKQKEFLFEGKRWFDLLRTSRRDANPMRVFNDFVLRNIPIEYRSLAESKFKSEWARYMPIPEEEMKTNTKMIQNPFYETSSTIVIN
ncbi:RagB/SusD family nutrient uptake outer membrane protein [Dysgonomonas sp. 216]|uniref:RagB/SusD family nutrient uptake outer membrane protein n=1 Tax=Dysgonomonas sp. 216 TaxID=2302934 RepID=UPI0013D7FC7B|nr:RagB/SusD family nutrient uptake outer membrane protein [Dysgonomonas sp. 216]NDW18956.1 RagB/SusD family nutrient uptake outer membrane protein [Dysgonomonas sp. 216]